MQLSEKEQEERYAILQEAHTLYLLVRSGGFKMPSVRTQQALRLCARLWSPDFPKDQCNLAEDMLRAELEFIRADHD